MSAEQWLKLMSRSRFRGATEAPHEGNTPDVRSPFVKDADRIIFSSAFRRLQDKTQVHPFPETDYVRTRLTHSLEVTSVGRALGTSVGKYVIKKYVLRDQPEPLEPGDFGAVVAAACLGHDIGNPPFGHAGEEAIRYWFTEGDGKFLLDGDLTEVQKEELRNFEGNAQGFRVLTRLQGWRENGGLQLSCAVLGTSAKYPWGCTYLDDSESIQQHTKFGYFQHDREAFKRIAETVGLIPSKTIGEWRRHPLTLLVEAADDICYLIVDVEDGFKSGMLNFRKTEELLRPIAEGTLQRYNQLTLDADRVAYLRAKAIGVLVDQAYKAFWENNEEILRGQFRGALLDYVSSQGYLSEIRQLAQEVLFNDQRKLETEAAGFEVIRGLLEIYSEALLSWEENGRDISRLAAKARTIMKLLPDYEKLPATRYQWLLRLTDYVSGMTDGFAVRLYRKLKGITVGLDLA